MIEYLLRLLANLPPEYVLVGLFLGGAFVLMIVPRWGLMLGIGLFAVVQSLATASDFRENIPLLGYLPAFLGVAILIRLMLARNPLPFPMAGWFWLLATLWFTLRLGMGPYGWLASSYGVFYLVVSMLGICVGHQVVAHAEFSRYYRVMIWVAAGLALLFLIGLLTGVKEAFRTGRLASYGLQANILGPTCAVGVMYALGYMMMGMLRGRVGIARVTMIVIALVAAFLTFSRSTIFPLLVAVALMLVSAEGKAIKRIAALVVVLAGVYGLLLTLDSLGVLAGSGWERILVFGASGRGEIIADIWKNNILPNLFIGQGFYGELQPGGILKHGDPHNSYFNTLVEQGVLGAVLVFGTVIFVMKAGLRLWRSPALNDTERFVARHSFISLFCYLLIATAVPNLWLHNTLMSFDFAVRMGMILSLATLNRAVLAQPPDP